MKVYTMLFIGNRDLEANAVSIRVHGKGNKAHLLGCRNAAFLRTFPPSFGSQRA